MLQNIRNVRGFLSDYFLGSVLLQKAGRGGRRRTTDRDSDQAYRRFARLHAAAEGRCADQASCRERFLRPLFTDILGFHLGEGADRIHGLFSSSEDEANGMVPLALVLCGEWDEDFDEKRGAQRRRLEEMLASGGVERGFLASGERLRLVRAVGSGPAGAYLEMDLEGLAEGDDLESFAAFLVLSRASQHAPGEDGRSGLDVIEEESRRHAAKVTTDLRETVFSTAEGLTASLIADAVAAGRYPGSVAIPELEVRGFRDAALTALYRLLFIFYAEGRDPRLDGHSLYRDSYSLSSLVEGMLRRPAEAWAANRFALDERLKALFGLYDKGLPRSPEWENIPPRGGRFFSPETPEGTILSRARLSDRAWAPLLLALATTRPRRGVGLERVSFRELDIESLGAVYEGLLEYEPRVATETTFEVRVQGRLFALPQAEVVRLCEIKSLTLDGELADAEEDDLEPDDAENDGEEAEGSDEDDAEGGGDGIKRGVKATIERRLEPGSFYFVAGSARKGSGSFYTPQSLVADVVRNAVGLLTKGRVSAQIESLRILDPACGSAHFLVETMRHLGQALHRAYAQEHGAAGPPAFRSTTGLGWDSDWKASDAEARAAASEARAWCKRRIAERCLFGVDLNPTAVELARVALWIESLAGDRPLTFFRHHVRAGNSLLGTWLSRLHAPPSGVKAKGWSAGELFSSHVVSSIREAARLRRSIDETATVDLGREGIDPESISELTFKEAQLARAEETLSDARLLFDLHAAAAFVPEIWSEWRSLCSFLLTPGELPRYAATRPWWEAFREVRGREQFFHWELEFPEVLLSDEGSGFDAVIGNPPWDKVLPTKTEFYARADVLIRAFNGNELEGRIRELHGRTPSLAAEFDAYQERTTLLASLLRKGGDFPLASVGSTAAHEDVSKYFLDRAIRLAAADGRVGMIVPSNVYNGEGCIGLRRYLLGKCAIERFYAFENRGVGKRGKLFPIDSRLKFVSLAFRKGASADGFRASFMRHDDLELERWPGDGKKAPDWSVWITREEVERYSPDSLAFLEYRCPRDQEIVRRMSEGRPTLGSEGVGSWGARLFNDYAHYMIYNGTRDRDLWTDPLTERLYDPRSVLGYEPSTFDDSLARMREKGFWPVFEGKHVEQFLAGIKPVRWWLSVEQAEAKYGKELSREPFAVFRETASNTNERTCIAAVLPGATVGSHKLIGIRTSIPSAEAVAVLNSLCFDYALRMRSAGTNVSFTYMRPMPVPQADFVAKLPTIGTRHAWAAGLSHITDDRSLWPRLWDINRAVAEAYGLGADDFEHILASFSGMSKKRKDFVAYLRARLEEWRVGSAAGVEN